MAVSLPFLYTRCMPSVSAGHGLRHCSIGFMTLETLFILLSNHSKCFEKSDINTLLQNKTKDIKFMQSPEYQKETDSLTK